MTLNRPVWIEVNLDHLAHNISEVRRVTSKDALVTAVIKADGYGHGALEIAETLLSHGAQRLAVATLTEGLQLRKRFKEVPILILGYTEASSIELAIENNLIQTIYSSKQAYAFNEVAIKLNKTLQVHIKIDTGMTRLGMLANQASVLEIESIWNLSHLHIEGIYTHFACADEKDKSKTQEQIEKFEWVRQALENRGVHIRLYHAANSAAVIDLPQANYDMVRAGIMLYGLYPSKEVSRLDIKLKEAMSLHAKISRVEKFEEGVGVSYGHRYITERPTTIATLPLGYADGFSRNLSFKASAWIKKYNKKAPVIGTICMDQCMIDVTGMDLEMGDEVYLFGPNLPIDEVAEQLGTINYEIVCMMNKRIPRVYTKAGKILRIVDNVLAL